jgi:hypothetical protein
LSVLALTVFGIVRRRRPGGPSELGWVTEKWLAEHRALAIAVSGVMLSAQLLYAQDLSRYREVEMGSTLLSVAGVNGVTPADAKVIHERPAVIQDLEWKPGRSMNDPTVQEDPVREVVFSFYNDQLFRIVVNYHRDRTLGLTDTDLIESLSVAYGSPATRTVPRPRVSETTDDFDEETVVARWENADSSVALIRATYPTPVRLVLLSKRLAGLARTAAAAAVRLDEREAPQREVQRLKTEADATRVAQGKARPVNKAAFKP